MLRAILFASCLLALAGLSVSFFLPTSRLLGRSQKLGSLATNRRRFSSIRTPLSRSTVTLFSTNKTPGSLYGESSAKSRPKWSSLEDLLSKFPERMSELNPDRDGFPKIAESVTQDTLDEAIDAEKQRCAARGKKFRADNVKILFVNEDGIEVLISMHSVWDGNTQHQTNKMSGREKPKWSSLEDLHSKFPERMSELNPDRGGFPKIAESVTQETLDEVMKAEKQRCTTEGKKFDRCQVKIPFVNEDGKEMLIRMKDVWKGGSQHPTDDMIEQWNKEMQEQQMNVQPKGGCDAAEREDSACNKLAALADTEIVLLEEHRLFDIAFPDSHPSGNVTYAQINVLDFNETSGQLNSGKSIGKLKHYLKGGGAVFILVLLHGEIECAYVLLPTDLADFEEATKGMNDSITFGPYPFSTRASPEGLSKLMSKYKVQARDLRAKVDEHKRTGPRQSQWYLDHDASQMSPEHYVEDQFLLAFNATFSGLGAKRIRHAPGDLLICGVPVEFKMASPNGPGFKIQIRGNSKGVADFNKVRVYCIVFKNETDPQKYTFVFLRSLTSRGTCAFAPEGGYDGNRRSFGFKFDPTASPPFSAKADQYDPSTLADVLVAWSGTNIEAINAFLQLCRNDPPMSDAEKERVSLIPPDRVKREQEAKRQGKSKKRQQLREMAVA